MAAIRYSGFWPGFASAWHCGASRGLFVSVVFSWAFCTLLLATFVWPSWLAGWFVVTAWLLFWLIWLVESVRGQFAIPRMLQNVSADTTTAFAEAQQEYLRGNWFEAEAILLEIVRNEPRDVAAGLLLVGVLRHTQRWKPALRRLEQLALHDAADGWRFEIIQEKRLIERIMKASNAAEEANRILPSVQQEGGERVEGD